MQSNWPLTIRLPWRRKARHNGPRFVSTNRSEAVNVVSTRYWNNVT
jgi:hypothetical protein